MDLFGTQWAVGGLAAALSAMGVAYIRERRQGRKDNHDFSIKLIEIQNKRIDELVFTVGELSGKVSVLSEHNAELLIENQRLISQNEQLRKQLELRSL